MKVKNLVAVAAITLASFPLLAQQPAPSAGPHPKSQEGNRGAAESASRAAGQGLGRRTGGHQ